MKSLKALLLASFLLGSFRSLYADTTSVHDANLLAEADQLLRDAPAIEYPQIARIPSNFEPSSPEIQMYSQQTKMVSSLSGRVKTLKTRRVKDPKGYFHLQAPGEWQLVNHPLGVLLRKQLANGETAVFGIRQMRHEQGADAILGRPATVSGLYAIRVDSSNSREPDIRNLEYFVDREVGPCYYIVLRAKVHQWPFVEDELTAMLDSLTLR